MILIFSKRNDHATSQVCLWLQNLQKEFIRLNAEDNYIFSYISRKKIIVEKNKKQYNLLECDSYWYRREGISPKHFNYRKTKLSYVEMNHVKMEYQTLKEYIYMTIEDNIPESQKIGSYFTRSVNKLHILDVAHKIGLKVPQTYVVCEKKYIDTSKAHITKPIFEGFYERENKNFLYSYTNELSDITSLPSTFMSSCIQEKLQKAFELRIFFLRDKYYSFAIFSQQDSDTIIDCRKGKTVRYVAYEIPKSIEFKLTKLVKQIQLVTGSIDMVVDTDGEYIFLEVNPVGQFVAYGEFCNSYLDKLIAENL